MTPPPLLDVDEVPTLPTRVLIAPAGRRAASGRLAQLACAVAVAPFAILTVLFVGADPA